MDEFLPSTEFYYTLIIQISLILTAGKFIGKILQQNSKYKTLS